MDFLLHEPVWHRLFGRKAQTMVATLVEDAMRARSQEAQRRFRVEHAIVEAAQLLISSGKVDLHVVLGLLGEATGAETIYFTELESEASAVVWQRQGKPSSHWLRELEARLRQFFTRKTPARPFEEPWPLDEKLIVVPVLSAQGRLHGYLVLAFAETPPQHEEEMRLLRVLGGLLATYLDRQAAEAALRDSEERWRRLVEEHPEPIVLTVRGKIVYLNVAGRQLLGLGEGEDISGRELLDFISADQYELLQRHLQQLESGTLRSPLECEIIRMDGEARLVELMGMPVPWAGQQAVQMILRDLTERRQAEERYRAFFSTITEGIWRIELRQPIAVTTLPELQLAHIYEQGYLAECNEVMARWLGAERPEALIGKPLKDLRNYFRPHYLRKFIQMQYRLHGEEYAVKGRQGKRYFVVNAVGAVVRDRLVRIWGSCAEVTEATTLERRMIQALEEQQQAIGRELHDGVGQLLTSVRMLSENLAQRLRTESHELAELASKVVHFAQEAAQDIRRIYRGLTPAQLYDEALTVALEELAYTTNTLGQIRCRFESDEAVHISDPEIKLHLYRIAQEAVHNAVKHSQASEIVISLRQREDAVELCVSDNGCGITLERTRPDSLGMRTMYYRAHAIGGSLHVQSQPGEGTTICCRMPLDNPL